MAESNNYGSYMAASSAFSAVSSIYGGILQSNALKQQGEYQKMMAGFNARLSEIQAQDAIDRGEVEATRLKKQTKQLVGEQRASLAAQGIDINSGSAYDVQQDAKEAAVVDTMTIRNNAAREAWGYKVQAQNSVSQGNYQSIAANQNANATMLTGILNGSRYAMDGISTYAKYNQTEQKGSVPMGMASGGYRAERDK